MRNRTRIPIALLFLASFPLSSAPAHAKRAKDVCGSAALALPPRPAAAMEGSAFVRAVAGLDEDERESAIREALMDGNLPPFLHQLAPVRLKSDGSGPLLTLCVAPDYLAVGSDPDYLLVPMRLETAVAVAGQYRFMLPTKRMVDAIYEQSAVHLRPQPLPAGEQMRSTDYYRRHNELIRAQRAALAAPAGALTSGHKKDLVLTNRLRRIPARVAIYGWHQAEGRPIQPLSTVHGERYADYSHGVRLVSAIAYVDGAPRPLVELLEDPRYAGLLSDEGPIDHVAQFVAGYGREAADSLAFADPAHGGNILSKMFPASFASLH